MRVLSGIKCPECGQQLNLLSTRDSVDVSCVGCKFWFSVPIDYATEALLKVWQRGEATE